MVLLNKIKSRGFTLIELMVVIAIIALLSSVVLAGMKGAKDKASTAALVASFRQIQIAMEQYKNATGYYPYENDVSNKSWSYTFGLTDNITPNLTTVSFLPTYIKKMPNPLVSGDLYTFFNPGPTYSFGAWGAYTCGGKPLKGYLFTYSASSNNYINLPAFSSFPTIYCITAN